MAKRSYSRNSQAAIEARARVDDERRQKKVRKQQIEYIVAGVLVAAGFITTVTGVMASPKAQTQIDAINVQIEEANALFNQKKSEEGATEQGLVVKVDATVNSAAEAGKQVCNMQNTLSSYVRTMRTTGKTTLTVDHQKTLEKLRSYFVNATGTVKGSWCEFGKWEFESTYDYEGVAAQVVWNCYDDSHDLLACCIATYDGDMDKFKNAVVYRTTKYLDAVANDVIEVPEVPEETTPVVTEPPVDENDDTGSGSVSIAIPDETEIVDSTISEPEDTTPVVTEPPIVIDEPFYEYPEEQWLYGWSRMYQCWGYFNQDGRFLTEEEYQMEVGY